MYDDVIVKNRERTKLQSSKHKECVRRTELQSSQTRNESVWEKLKLNRYSPLLTVPTRSVLGCKHERQQYIVRSSMRVPQNKSRAYHIIHPGGSPSTRRRNLGGLD